MRRLRLKCCAGWASARGRNWGSTGRGSSLTSRVGGCWRMSCTNGLGFLGIEGCWLGFEVTHPFRKQPWKGCGTQTFPRYNQGLGWAAKSSPREELRLDRTLYTAGDGPHLDGREQIPLLAGGGVGCEHSTGRGWGDSRRGG